MRMEKTPKPKLLPLLGAALLVLAGCGSSSKVEGGGSETPMARGLATTLGTRSEPARRSPAPRSSGAAGWVDYETPETYAGTVKHDNIVLTMDDGTAISLQVVRPTGADGTAESSPLPTIVTFTPYNKNVTAYVSLGGAINPYFVKRGYNHVQVDVRGTGRSGGGWDPFSAREQQDYPQVIDWVIRQPWSNGVVGTWGISATATTALLAAKGGHPAIKAVFPIVPHGDIYRDVVLVGGQGSIAFLPAWMAVVTALATVNPAFHDQPAQYAAAVADHLLGLNGFLVPRTLGVLAAEPDTAYDNGYWADKAPLEVARGVKVPTFIVGGLFDIFQRSEPLNYEALKGHTTAKLLIGPWHHLEAATGTGLPMDGVPSLDHIAMMWFDRYLKDIPNGAEHLPNVTQWVWGHERFDTSSDWPHPQARAQRLYLQGGSLAEETPAAGAAPATVIQQPFNGVCSESAMQIAIGIVAYAPLPCWYSDNLAQTLEATFDTAPLEQDLYINGPIQADIWISTTALDAGLVVRVSDLEPNGNARSLSSGLQTASLRAVDASRSRWLDGQMIQPWHPFTADSVETVGIGNLVHVPVEVFPTSALIRKGHRLRISVGASNFPFAMMPIPNLLQSLAGVMSIYGDAQYPSSVVIPVVPVSALQATP